MQPVAPPATKDSPKQEVKREVLELVKMVLLFLILFWGLKTFVVEGYEVQGQSMLPTLSDRERILVFKLPFHLSKLPLLSGLAPIGERDIIVFESDPTYEVDRSSANKRFIKRVIARGPERQRGNVVDAQHRDAATPTPGAVKVVFDHGRVYVNNQRVEEHYIEPQERTSPDERPPIYLEAGQYYVLGDHRGVSKDSRVFGPIDERQIIGRAVFRFWPLSKFGPL
jgi:signal peptidase I